MPATDLSADKIILNFSSAYIQQKYRRDGITEANLYKLARAVSNGFLLETGQAIDLLEPQRFDLTAQQGFLSNRGIFWNASRQPSEGDESLRLRIGQVKLVKWGAFNVDEMLELLAVLLNTTVSGIMFTENIDETGDFEPGLIHFFIEPAIFTLNGIDDIPSAVTLLEQNMEMVAPAGVRVIISSSGTGQWDDGVSQWDDGVSTYS